MNTSAFHEAVSRSHAVQTGALESHGKEGKRLLQKTLRANSAENAYAELVNMLEEDGETFEDDEFPTKIESIYGSMSKSDKPKWKTFCWLRPDDFFGKFGYKLFEGKIEPSDIQQGQLGDCYFLSTLASIAEKESRIRKIFLSSGRPDPLNNNGVFCVQMLTDGLMRPIFVDNYFPCISREKGPCFSRSGSEADCKKELWVMVLEKAWAKIYGGYGTIEAGLTSETMHDLTGAPVKRYLICDPDLLKDLKAADKKDYAMTAGCESDTGLDECIYEEVGLITSHAYSLLSVAEVEDDAGHKFNLVRLRNPWGQREWNGEWSDNCPNWTPKIRKQIADQLGTDSVSRKNDGAFYMEFADFTKYFGDVNIAMIKDEYIYSSVHVRLDPHNLNQMYLFEVKQEGHYSFVASQPTKKSKIQYDPEYDYSPIILIAGKINQAGKAEYMSSSMGQTRDSYIYPTHYKPGYYVIQMVSFGTGHHTDQHIVMGSYGPTVIEMSEIDAEKKKSLERDLIHHQVEAKKDEWEDYKKYGDTNIKHYKLSKPDEGQVVFYYNNQGKSVLNEEINFTEMKNCKLSKPFEDTTKISVTVNPGQQMHAILRCYPGYSYKYVRSVNIEKSIQEKVKEAIARGSKMPKKQGSSEVDINGHVLKFTDGYIYVLHNKTKDMSIKETVNFKLQNLRIEGNESATSLNIECKPGEVKYVSLKRIPMTKVCSVGFGFKYTIST